MPNSPRSGRDRSPSPLPEKIALILQESRWLGLVAVALFLAMDLLDSFGQTTHLVFQRLERNPSLPASLFHFSVPAGADVVGE